MFDSNLAKMYCAGIKEPLFSVIELKLAANAEIDLIRNGSYLIKSPLIGKV
jgi:hypothetical protein